MMGSIYTETMKIRACHCDLGGTWRPSSVLETMQETAGTHCELRDLSRTTMDSMGIAWVLSRTRVEFARVPHMGERISVDTYHTPAKHLFFPRSHVFKDEEGKEIGRANSLWVLLNIHERRVVKNDTVLMRLCDNDDMNDATRIPASVHALDVEQTVCKYKPQFTDFDINAHVNNTRYLDWCCNALGVDVLSNNCIAAFDVNYDAEIRPGYEIRTELSKQNDEFAFCGYDGTKRLFGIRGQLVIRD